MPTILDTFYVDVFVNKDTSTPASGAYVLQSGRTYVIQIDGNFAWWINSLVPHGAPDTIIYPSPGRAIRPAAMDAEVIYADILDRTLPRHIESNQRLLLDLGSGFTHRHPDGGLTTTTTPGHAYTYTVTGQGSVLRGCIQNGDDSAGRNGQLRVRVHHLVTGHRPIVGRLGFN